MAGASETAGAVGAGNRATADIAVVDAATRPGRSDQTADAEAAAAGDAAVRGIAVVDLAIKVKQAGQRTDLGLATDAGINQTDVADTARDITKQAYVTRAGLRDTEMADGMAKAVKIAGKGRAIDADGRKAAAAVPARRGRGVNISPQRIIAGEICAHALQVSAAGAAGITQGVDDLIADHGAV